MEGFLEDKDVTINERKNMIVDRWNNRSDEYFVDVYDEYTEVIKNPQLGFPFELYPLFEKHVGNLKGKKVLVPSSGDNAAAFALHLLGAKVVSTDISENQLKNAKLFADKQGWDMEFLVQDTMKLDDIKDNEYDLVYTSNGVHVWIDDMPGMYKSIHRVLKPSGYNIFFETHPVGRPFTMNAYDVKIVKSYLDIYPQGESLTHAWRTEDFVNAVISSGLVLREMKEIHSHREDLNHCNYLTVDDNDRYNWPGDTFDWKVNPWAALPQALCLVSQKRK